jgi:signal transduction histidine kinase
MESGEARSLWRLGPLGKAVAPFVSAAIVVAFGALAYGGVRSTNSATALVSHTHQVIETTDQVLTRLVDAETGERGYIITGDTIFLDPYHGAERDAIERIADLHKLSADPSQQARINQLSVLVRRRFETLDARIETRLNHGFERVRADFRADNGGKPLMDSIRTLLADMGTEESHLLTARTASQRGYQTRVAWIVIAGASAAALLALVISLMLSRSAANEARLSSELRRRADELQIVNDQLAERTLEAEQANRVKADFLANMSHDLRTPLNAIVGYVDLLETGVHGPIRGDQAEDLSRIKRSAGHLRSLIIEVLDFAKIEAGQLQLALEDVRVDGVISGLRPLVETQAAAKGLTLETSCVSGLTVRADREKTDQILVNLVANAIKFTEAGGRVSIECCADGKWIRIDVRDTGGGIPADQLDAIFTPFVQVDASGYRGNDRGVGLGLPISRELARAMHGDITVASAVGEGSTFTLRLPSVARQPSNLG